MKGVKEIVRHYYKYNYDEWTSPLLDSNGIVGSDKFSVWGAIINIQVKLGEHSIQIAAIHQGIMSGTMAMNIPLRCQFICTH